MKLLCMSVQIVQAAFDVRNPEYEAGKAFCKAPRGAA